MPSDKADLQVTWGPQAIRSACPSCGVVAVRETYDIGDGPELACSNCEWCWGANGQDLKPLTLGDVARGMSAEQREQLRADGWLT